MRPEQWVKNVCVLAPAFFAGVITRPSVLLPAVQACVAFCLLSSAVYCFNDIVDAESDRLSPVKCHRPVASRAVSPFRAALLALLLALSAFVLSVAGLDLTVAYILGVYFLVNIGYTLWLKRFSLIDISLIALGFVLRLCAGSAATRCPLSDWIVIVTFVLAVFLALGKRREDVAYYMKEGKSLRATASRYSLRFIESAMALTGAAIITSYFIYTIIPSKSRIITSDYFYVTGLPVITGILRYLQVCIDDNKGAKHHKLLISDPVILASVVVYLVMFIFFLYGVSCGF